jgi:hypothetical protein
MCRAAGSVHKGDCMSRPRGMTVIHGDRSAHVPSRTQILEYLTAMSGELSTLAERAGAETLMGLFDLARREAMHEQERYTPDVEVP